MKGNADLLGIPADVCAEFSKRRAQIIAAAGQDVGEAVDPEGRIWHWRLTRARLRDTWH